MGTPLSYVTEKSLEIQIQNFQLLKTFSRPLFDEDSIELVSAGSLALVFELRCIDSKFSKNRKKGHRSVDASRRVGLGLRWTLNTNNFFLNYSR